MREMCIRDRYIANKSINIVEMDACSGDVKSALAYIKLHYADKDIGLDTCLLYTSSCV